MLQVQGYGLCKDATLIPIPHSYSSHPFIDDAMWLYYSKQKDSKPSPEDTTNAPSPYTTCACTPIYGWRAHMHIALTN